MKKIYRVLSALAVLTSLCCCGLEEPIDIRHNYESSIEFVARSVGYNDQVVETKSAATPGIETNIYSCYFLVYDTTPTTGGDNLIYCSDNLISGTDPVQAIPTQRLNISKKGVKTVKACFIVNVPRNFIYSETDGTPLLNKLTALNSAVLGPDHFSYATNSDTVPMGTPQMTINGVYDVKCIPAFGITPTDIDIANDSAVPVSITIKRLFAKVSVDLKMQLNLSENDNTIQTLTHYELRSLKLYNIPTNVKLVEDSQTESEWRTTAGLYSSTPIEKSLTDTRIYNIKEGETSSLNQLYSYSFYVPEYYLEPIANAIQSQEFKPQNFPNEESNRTYPMYIQLEGSFVKYSVLSSTITYKVYLGGDAVDDFSLARNTHYKNDLTIVNTNKNNQGSQDDNTLDHRVSISDIINNPVAKAGKAANCYIINRAQKYEFPAYKGAYNNLNDAVVCTGGNAVRVIANKAQFQNNWTDLTNINIQNLSYNPDNNMISFEIKKPVNVDMVPNGNIVIALVNDNGNDKTDDDPIIWSWHLWFMSDYGDLDAAGWAKITNNQVSENVYIMDRNLGAMTKSDYGCYYIYGTKKPFIDNQYVGGGTHGKDTWDPAEDVNTKDNTKAVNDPCPPGYKVPGQIFEAHALNTSSSSSNYNYSSSITFPYSRSRNSSGVQADKIKGSDTYPDHTGYYNSSTDNDQITGEVVEITTSSDGKTQTGYKLTKVQKTFTNYQYSVETVIDFGYLWSNDNYAYKYNFSSMNWENFLTVFRVVSADVKVVTTKQPVKRTWRYVVWGTWLPDGSSFPVTTNEIATSDFPTGTSLALMNQIYNNPEGAPVGNGNSDYTNQTSGIAAPIRCLKE